MRSDLGGLLNSDYELLKRLWHRINFLFHLNRNYTRNYYSRIDCRPTLMCPGAVPRSDMISNILLRSPDLHGPYEPLVIH